MKPISDEIKKLENKNSRKVPSYSEEDVKKSTELNNQLDSIRYKHTECLIDCERRKRDSSVSVKEEPQQPISDELKKEFDELDNDDDHSGGNKRRARLPRRRRSLRNRTHRQPRQTRRNQRRNTRRRNGRHHRTRSDRK